MHLAVNEIFHSIQGESLHAGRPCVFVRLTGCNLRCAYCDTRYAYSEGEALSLEAIVDRIGRFGCRLVEITGGEPLLQPGTPALAARLLAEGYTVLLETNGTLDVGLVDPRVIKIMDVKCPGSRTGAPCDRNNFDRLGPADQVKFVIGDRKDFTYAAGVTRRWLGRLPGGNVLFSPVFNQLDPALLARWILSENLDVRLHLQLHKVVWAPDLRGV